jgi:predicted ATP-binding protein involved in virulence
MRISHIVLKHFRKYDHARFHFHPQFTVLIGSNGAGKTTVLDAVALMLNTWFQGVQITTGGGVIKKADNRTFYREKEGQVFLESTGKAQLLARADVDGTPIFWLREQGDRGAQARDFVNLGIAQREQAQRTLIESSDQPKPVLPLLLYYGASRLWAVHDAVETGKPDSHLAGYRFCLDPKSDQKAFEKWFKKLAFSALQNNRPIPAMDAVKTAVLTCIPGAEDFRHDVAHDQLIIKLQQEGWVAFHDLSDGYRNMVAMVADIAHRASLLNVQLGERAALETPGICLIDEIDLHLHPKWQRGVVADLQAAFPRIQFIATTHSPFIIQSLSSGEVIDLNLTLSPVGMEHLPPDVAAPGPAQSFANRSIEDIVEQVMGVALPQRSQRYQAMFDAARDYYSLLQQASDTTQEQKKRLKAKLDELSAPFSDNVAYHAFLEMERLAAGLGKQPKTEVGNATD